MAKRPILALIGISAAMVSSFGLLAAHAQSYSVSGETNPPSSEGLVSGTPGLVGIFFGHLPQDGRPRQKVLLILFADPKSGAPRGYTLERILNDHQNLRRITKGSWSPRKDQARPGAVIYELDSAAPAELRYFWAIDKATLLVLDKDLKTWRSGFGDPYTAAYALYARHCNAGQTLKDCTDE